MVGVAPFDLQPGDVSIGRLRCRRAAVAAAGKRLAEADWPRQPDGAWLIIRQLHVRGAEPWLALRAGARATELSAAAVSGTSPEAENALAVRFESLAALLARLSADLVSGRARHLWFWQAWRRLTGLPATQALRDLWLEHVPYLPSVTVELAELGALRSVWRAIDPPMVARLQDRLGGLIGKALPPARETGSAGVGPVPPVALLRRWQGVLDGFPAAEPRCWLAAVLVTLEWRPTLFGDEAGAGLARVEAALRLAPGGRSAELPSDGAGSSAAVPDASAPDEGRETSVAPGESATARARRAANAPRAATLGPEGAGWPGRESAQADSGVPSAAAASAPGRRRLPNAGSAQPGAGRPTGFRASTVPPSAPDALSSDPAATRWHADGPGDHAAPNDLRQRVDQDRPATGEPDPDGPGPLMDRSPDGPGSGSSGRPDSWAVYSRAFDTFRTRQGGLFYLINFLNRPEVQALLDEAGGMGSMSSGWAWLFRLGMELGLEPEGDLAAFLAASMGLEEPRELLELEQLPRRGALLDLAHRLYAGTGVWDPELLRVPSLCRASASHLDLYYPLSAVRLEVRLSALDINPGWVPWLGRVVSFHYQESSAGVSAGADP